MGEVAATVKDVSRAIARLDEHALLGPNDQAEIHSVLWSIDEMRTVVASNIAYQLARHAPNYVRGKVTARDVQMVMASHGATTLTIERHAKQIARAIRSDFSDGGLR